MAEKDREQLKRKTVQEASDTHLLQHLLERGTLVLTEEQQASYKQRMARLEAALKGQKEKQKAK